MHELTEHEWAKSQTNTPLQDKTQVAIAKLFTTAHGLPLNHDPGRPAEEQWKNWDNMLAIHHAIRTTERLGHILDAGACRDPVSPSVFLPGLQSVGYMNLFGCNLDEPAGVTMVNNIAYSHQDITCTKYPDNLFDYVACLSVIEHGVDWRKYFLEMSRIIAPGGYLFTSFDYWPDPIDTGNRTAFGVPVRIFNMDDVMQMVVFAAGVGLQLTKDPSLRATNPVVNWLGLNYTFFNLLLKKY